jgi:hypothetical protein
VDGQLLRGAANFIKQAIENGSSGAAPWTRERFTGQARGLETSFLGRADERASVGPPASPNMA